MSDTLTDKAALAKHLQDALVPLAKAASDAAASLPRSTSLPMLAALMRTGSRVYAGTADPVKVARRRAANKRARKSRRINRHRNARKGVR